MPDTSRLHRKHPLLSLPAWTPTPRYEVEVTVTAHRQVIGHEFEIVFHAPAIARTAQPGQFVEILFGENYAPLVRRPFSLYRVDRSAATFSVLYLARGAFTSALAQKKQGDVVSLLGPLGRPFHLTTEAAVRHILVAGGIGAPPLYFLASELSRTFVEAQPLSTLVKEALHESPNAEPRILVINAARTESLLVGLSEFGELEIALHVMTDDGSRGARGMATEMLSALLDAEVGAPLSTQIYACGPMPMLRSVGEIAIARNLPCQLSIETPMPCGIGICQGCATPVHDPASPSGFSYALGCVDGPVFEARDLLW